MTIKRKLIHIWTRKANHWTMTEDEAVKIIEAYKEQGVAYRVKCYNFSFKRNPDMII